MKGLFLIERIKYLGMTVVGESDGGIIVGSIMKGYETSFSHGIHQMIDLLRLLSSLQRCRGCWRSHSTRRYDSPNERYQFRTYIEQWCSTTPTWDCKRCQVIHQRDCLACHSHAYGILFRSIKLVIAKRWNDHQGIMDDSESQGYFPLPHPSLMNNNARQDPIRPIDPRQWVAQTNAVLMRRRSSLSPPPAASSTLSSSPPHSPCQNNSGKSKSCPSHITPPNNFRRTFV